MAAPDTLYGVSRRGPGAVVLLIVALLVGFRAVSEIAMMSQHGTDPQMPIWIVFLAGKLVLWLLAGGALAGLMVAVWPKRWGSVAVVILLLIWSIAICAASWQYWKARQALADASDPSTSAERLHELVDFEGIEAGYELDNRLASHSNTKADDLRTLSQRNQLGTQIILAANPNTPSDVLQMLVEHDDVLVHRSLAGNPNLPASVVRELEDHPDEMVREILSRLGGKK